MAFSKQIRTAIHQNGGARFRFIATNKHTLTRSVKIYAGSKDDEQIIAAVQALAEASNVPLKVKRRGTEHSVYGYARFGSIIFSYPIEF